jgi:predicted flap endonuclease-1-like 5' DNA nuclease
MANKKINDVEGIGPVIGEKLKNAGAADTDSLLNQAKTPALRKALAAKAGLTEKQLLRFANMVDLYRISGVGSEYADLLEAAGVDTVPELARRTRSVLGLDAADPRGDIEPPRLQLLCTGDPAALTQAAQRWLPTSATAAPLIC